ncbi:MAG: hypothetical protein COX52_08115, partial [Syntrophobacterales bacterium CG23_combo_of_CG06-09_8_20_14_all_48_27]
NDFESICRRQIRHACISFRRRITKGFVVLKLIIRRTTQFKQDIKRLLRSGKDIEKLLGEDREREDSVGG